MQWLGSSDFPTRGQIVGRRGVREHERRGVEGSVDLSFTIDPEGKVTDVIVDHSEPSDIFDRAAASAV